MPKLGDKKLNDTWVRRSTMSLRVEVASGSVRSAVSAGCTSKYESARHYSGGARGIIGIITVDAIDAQREEETMRIC